VTHACNPIYSGGKIKRISVQSQPRQIVQGTLSQKKSFAKRAGGVAQGVGPEFNPVPKKKKKKYCPNASRPRSLISLPPGLLLGVLCRGRIQEILTPEPRCPLILPPCLFRCPQILQTIPGLIPSPAHPF
jgi:hypothetical protein